ncbi:hypothetical protein Tco_0869762 [Tanacetum coccineum]
MQESIDKIEADADSNFSESMLQLLKSPTTPTTLPATIPHFNKIWAMFSMVESLILDVNKNEFADGDVAPVAVVAPIAAIAPVVAPLEQSFVPLERIKKRL